MIVDGGKFLEAREKAGISRIKLAIIGGYSSEVRIFQIEKNHASEVPDIRLSPMLKAMGVSMSDVAGKIL